MRSFDRVSCERDVVMTSNVESHLQRQSSQTDDDDDDDDQEDRSTLTHTSRHK